MNKRYVIDTIFNKTAIEIYQVPKDIEVVSGGTMVDPISIQYKSTKYEKYKELYDIILIFEDNIPVIDIYTIPLISIFAMDSIGGLVGRIETISEFSSDEPICYINSQKDCFIVANNSKEFFKLIDEGLWNDILKSTKKTTQISVYNSKSDAEESGVIFLSNSHM